MDEFGRAVGQLLQRGSEPHPLARGLAIWFGRTREHAVIAPQPVGNRRDSEGVMSEEGGNLRKVSEETRLPPFQFTRAAIDQISSVGGTVRVEHRGGGLLG